MGVQRPELVVHLPAVDAVEGRITSSCTPSVPQQADIHSTPSLRSGQLLVGPDAVNPALPIPLPDSYRTTRHNRTPQINPRNHGQRSRSLDSGAPSLISQPKVKLSTSVSANTSRLKFTDIDGAGPIRASGATSCLKY